MNDKANGSVGQVSTWTAKIDLPSEGLKLESGAVLKEIQIAYEAYGDLSPEKDNVIFVCHALSGDAHVAGYHDNSDPKTAGWWEEMVGPGKGIDTNHYHVICANILGGCSGTTGPSSVDPATGKPYGSSFPEITVGDIVDVHVELLKHLGIEKLASVIGGSFGGMQALEWSIRYPEMIVRSICIASAASLSAQALAFDVIGRKAIVSDPNWQGGDYYESGKLPTDGLAHARKIGHITYLSPEIMATKFGRDKKEKGTVFEVESYLEYQGEKFIKRFDANSYQAITKAMDEYDLVQRCGSLPEAFNVIEAKLLVVALSADWLFPAEQSMEIANALLRAGKQVSYCNLYAPYGHDAFLVDIEHLSEVVRAFLPWVGKPDSDVLINDADKQEFNIICDILKEGTKVLDLGCGGGNLLSLLSTENSVSGIGLDIDIHNVIEVIDKGHDVFQGDIDAGLAMIPDHTYDYVVLNETIQEVQKPRQVINEMLRVAKEGIVSFPNFGQLSNRFHLWGRGRMPKGGALPFEWYNTPNIHLFTLKDFCDLCREDNIEILDTVCIPSGAIGKLLIGLGLCNLGADRILMRITRGDSNS